MSKWHTLICWCNNCGKEWYQKTDDLEKGVEEGIYYGGEKDVIWRAESCCDDCLEEIKTRIY